MLRRLAKTGLATALHWTGTDTVIGAVTGPKHLPLVIGYHMVVENLADHADVSIPASRITLKMLERQLEWLARRYQFIALDEMAMRVKSGRLFDRPTVAITFDDGYENVYQYAFPLLKRKGIPAGLFLVTDLIGTRRLQIYDKLYVLLAMAFKRWRDPLAELARLLRNLGLPFPRGTDPRVLSQDLYAVMRTLFTTYSKDTIDCVIQALEAECECDEAALTGLHPVSWDMVIEMHLAGMTIGSHTKTHVLLTNEPWQTVLEETSGSQRVLEWKLGVPVEHFSYPDGRFNMALVSCVADAGYRFAYTCCHHRDPRYPLLTIPRKFLWENTCLNVLDRFSPSIMSCQVNWVFELFDPCGQDHGWPSEIGGRHTATGTSARLAAPFRREQDLRAGDGHPHIKGRDGGVGEKDSLPDAPRFRNSS